MDDQIKRYADALYDQSLNESARILREDRVRSLQEIAARRSTNALPLSGPEIRRIGELFVQHVERCMEARLASYRKAYSEAELYPTDEDLNEILTSIRNAQDLQVNHSTRAFHEIVKSHNLGAITGDLSISSAHGHDRVLEDWKVWREKIHLAKTSGNDDRKFARIAIEEALKSIPEDDRPHPKVGAVVVKNGQIVSKAHRGENPKSHAEYIALEEKLSDEFVTGSTVYTTLEPCTTRRHPKLPCAERLIERKVSRVLIGMLDPNPDITGRGWQTLREAGIETRMFDHDLMQECEEMNREFTRTQKQKKSATKKNDHNSPYSQDLECTARQVLQYQMTLEGRHVLRHLLLHEPVEIGTLSFPEIPQDRQYAQIEIAKRAGLVKLQEDRQGALVRTYWVISPQFRPVLENVLYEKGMLD